MDGDGVVVQLSERQGGCLGGGCIDREKVQMVDKGQEGVGGVGQRRSDGRTKKQGGWGRLGENGCHGGGKTKQNKTTKLDKDQ